MELINNVFLLLAFSSLFSSAIAICVPRNALGFVSTSIPPTIEPQIAPQTTESVTASLPQSPSAQTPQVEVTVSPPQSPPTQAPPATVTVSPPQSPSPSTNSAPAEEEQESASEEDSGLPEFQKLPSDNLVSSVASSTTTDLVEICDVTSNPQLCKTSISSQIHGMTVDPTSALKTEIQQSMKEVTKAIATLKELRKDPSASNVEIACYDTCLENFDIAIEDLKAGLESIDVHDVGRMESVLTAVLTDLMTCDDTFAEMGVDSPLDSLSTRMSKYASNCLAISKLLL
ncbi:21 kDa protein-like [Benincasa hispida]|uniref:21 kDa protein-like n=1 Tax=Benincasa hispida TaxID=102211 RepID=UPI0018FFE68E|nr:21 kDa protein-like [Benincasa hispida]